LDDTEFEIMKSHVLIAKKIIEDIINRFNIKEPFIVMAKNIAAYHHEKYNGQGYPEGMKGEATPIEAKIFAVADVYDALRSKRSYKKTLSHGETVHFIMSKQGEHFDPDVVAAFLTIENKIEKISFSNPTQSTGDQIQIAVAKKRMLAAK
jgi:putative two-component system response regulator